MIHEQTIPQVAELSWKDVINALSLANMVLGLLSIFCSFSRKPHCASWMLLISFLLDMAVGTMTRHLNICHKLGLELNDFAVFTTFGLASALLLRVDGPLNGFLAVIYVLTTSFRLCFYPTVDTLQKWSSRELQFPQTKEAGVVRTARKTSQKRGCKPSIELSLAFQGPEGGPSAYKGLPCPYASCVLASTCLLTKDNTFILCCMASLMILFMIDQSCYPPDEILESENWKKVVYMGGVVMLFFSPFSLSASYCLIWSLSYIFFPDALWGRGFVLSSSEGEP